MANYFYHNKRYWFVFWMALILPFLLSSCGQPTNVIEVDENAAGVFFRVREDVHRAEATLYNINTFEPLATGDWENPTISQWWVATDSIGEAQICPSDAINADGSCQDHACHIYVFASSDFGPYCCPKSDLGMDTCSCSGTQAFDDCHYTTTYSADVEAWGTWYSVTYLWESQITIVIVGEGEVQVTPVTALNFEGEIPPLNSMDAQERGKFWQEFRNSERVLGNPQRINVDELEAAHFYFTAPLDKLEELNFDQEQIHDNDWITIEQLPLLVDQLKILDYRIDPWINHIWTTAIETGINLGPQPEIQQDYLVLTAVGQPWDDPALQETILYGVDWNILVEEFFDPRIRVSLTRQDEFGIQTFINSDTRQVLYDPGLANQRLKEAGFDEGFQITLVIPAEDDFLIDSAELMTAYMKEIGIQMEIMVLDRTVIFDKVRAMEAAGMPSILYDRR